MKVLFKSGLRHCHVRDLFSYVIRDRISPAEGMIRVFHNTGESLSSLVGTQGEFMLAPHNHRQDITLLRIAGSPVNVDFSIDRLVHGKQQREWRFVSALLTGEFSLEWSNTVDLRVSNAALIPDSGVYLSAEQVHTVIAPPGSAWMVIEGQIATPSHRSLCYSLRPGLVLNSNGLYLPMEEVELDTAASLPIFSDLREMAVAA